MDRFTAITPPSSSDHTSRRHGLAEVCNEERTGGRTVRPVPRGRGAGDIASEPSKDLAPRGAAVQHAGIVTGHEQLGGTGGHVDAVDSTDRRQTAADQESTVRDRARPGADVGERTEQLERLRAAVPPQQFSVRRRHEHRTRRPQGEGVQDRDDGPRRSPVSGDDDVVAVSVLGFEEQRVAGYHEAGRIRAVRAGHEVDDQFNGPTRGALDPEFGAGRLCLGGEERCVAEPCEGLRIGVAGLLAGRRRESIRARLRTVGLPDLVSVDAVVRNEDDVTGGVTRHPTGVRWSGTGEHVAEQRRRRDGPGRHPWLRAFIGGLHLHEAEWSDAQWVDLHHVAGIRNDPCVGRTVERPDEPGVEHVVIAVHQDTLAGDRESSAARVARGDNAGSTGVGEDRQVAPAGTVIVRQCVGDVTVHSKLDRRARSERDQLRCVRGGGVARRGDSQDAPGRAVVCSPVQRPSVGHGQVQRR